MNKYAYQKVPRTSMRDELIAWEMLDRAQRPSPEGTTLGDLVEEVLQRVHEICERGDLGLEVESRYIDWDRITDERLDRGGW